MKIKSIRKINCQSKKYDIMVERDNNFFANGVLVHNCVMSREFIHARSEEGYGKPWQTHVKSQWANFRYEIPEGMEICGENMYAVHSIEYDKLSSYFYIFGIVYNGSFLSWKETNEWCQLLGLPIVPTIFIGKLIVNMPIPEKSAFGGICEGYVARNIDSFKVEDFSGNVAKCVRMNHVQSDIHWTKTWKQAKLL